MMHVGLVDGWWRAGPGRRCLLAPDRGRKFVRCGPGGVQSTRRDQCVLLRARGVACRLCCMHIPTRSQVTTPRNKKRSINPPARRRLCWPGRAWPHRRKKRPQTCRGDAPFRTSCALSYGARSSKRCVCCSEAWSSRAARCETVPTLTGLRATTTTEDTLRARVATTPVRELGIAHGAHAGRRADGR